MARRRISPARLKRWLRGEIDTALMLGVPDEDRAQLAWEAHQRLESGQTDDAARIFRLLRILAPSNDVQGRLGEGVCLQVQGALAEAETAYGEVLALDPGNAFALANRGEVRLVAGRIEAALADLSQAVIQLEGSRAPAEFRGRVERLRELALDAKKSGSNIASER
jgi:Flp pilus assembly protein TadD